MFAGIAAAMQVAKEESVACGKSDTVVEKIEKEESSDSDANQEPENVATDMTQHEEGPVVGSIEEPSVESPSEVESSAEVESTVNIESAPKVETPPVVIDVVEESAMEVSSMKQEVDVSDKTTAKIDELAANLEKLSDSMHSSMDSLKNKLAVVEEAVGNMEELQKSARGALKAVDSAYTKLSERSATLDDLPTRKEMAKLAVDSSLQAISELKVDLKEFLDGNLERVLRSAVSTHADRLTSKSVNDLVKRTLIQAHAHTVSVALRHAEENGFMTDTQFEKLLDECSEEVLPKLRG